MSLRKWCPLVDTSSNNSLKICFRALQMHQVCGAAGHFLSNVLGLVIGEHIKTQGSFKKTISRGSFKAHECGFSSFLFYRKDRKQASNR